jgi:hypothetical protein
MRIWDLPPEKLCREHLLGEHYELHALWAIIIRNRKGYARHPETLRWKGKLRALYLRHQKLVREMKARGYRHRSPLDSKLARGRKKQDKLIHSIAEQKRILKGKGCDCRIG